MFFLSLFTSLQKTTMYFCPTCSSIDRYQSFVGTTCASGQEKYSPSLNQKIEVELFVSNIGTSSQTTLPHIRDHIFIPANVRTSHLMHVISMTLPGAMVLPKNTHPENRSRGQYRLWQRMLPFFN